MNSSLSNRCAALVFLFTLLAGTSGIAGCAGGVSASAPSPEPPPAQPVAAMLTVILIAFRLSPPVGNTSTETVTATNMGDATVAINQATSRPQGFSTAGLTVPANLAVGQSQIFTAAFPATTPGTLSILTNASSDPVVVPLSATAASPSSTPTPPAPSVPIVADPESNLDSVLLPTVGNSQVIDCNGNWVNRRDSVDVRIITQYQDNSPGGYFTTADSTHSNPSVAAGTACTESLHDGIPDQWKSAQGPSATDPNLYKTTAPNGYTYLENYINGSQE